MQVSSNYISHWRVVRGRVAYNPHGDIWLLTWVIHHFLDSKHSPYRSINVETEGYNVRHQYHQVSPVGEMQEEGTMLLHESYDKSHQVNNEHNEAANFR